MQVKIQTYRMVKESVTDFAIELPDKPFYFFEFGYRIAWAVVPIWTTYQHTEGKDEEIWCYHVTGVSNSFGRELYHFRIDVMNNTTDLSRTYNREKGDHRKRILRHFGEYTITKRMERTEEQWKADFQSFRNHIVAWASADPQDTFDPEFYTPAKDEEE